MVKKLLGILTLAGAVAVSAVVYCRQDNTAETTTGDVESLLEARDNLTRALNVETDDVDALKNGVRLTAEQFDDALAERGVRQFEPEVGAEVDAHRHEAVERVESDVPPGAVAEVYRNGYETEERVLRAAQVAVCG